MRVDDGSGVLESPSSTMALRNQLRLSRPGSYYFGAGGGLGFGLAAAVGVQLAEPNRPVVCVIGEGSVQYAVTAFWSAVAYRVPVTFLVLRNEEYAILKWFADIEQVEGAPGLDLGGGRPGHGPLLTVPLLAPDVQRIAPEVSEPADDRAPDWVAGGTPQPLRGELESLLGPDSVLSRALDLVRYASDASPYRLFPKAVAMARGAEDVAKLVRFSRQSGVPLTFRAAGTSHNGQGQGDGILVDVRRHFTGVTVE